MNVDEWIDQGVKLIQDDTIMTLANQEKLKANKPHVIDSPLGCKACGYWGAGLTHDNLCGNCNEFPGNILVNCLRGNK